LFGVNGAGKSTRVLIDNLVAIRDRSLVVFDMKGELAAQTPHRARRRLGDVKIINPYGVVGLPSDGYNPLAALNPDDEQFRQGQTADAGDVWSDLTTHQDSRHPAGGEAALSSTNTAS
jgi:type IV secretory pathway TraG/TraD family ATPase VirD4